MSVLYVSFGYKVIPRIFGCVAMGSALLGIFRSRLLVYSAGSVNRVQVVLSGFSMRLFCFVQAKTFCRYGCIYFWAAFVLVCVDVMKKMHISSDPDIHLLQNIFPMENLLFTWRCFLL